MRKALCIGINSYAGLDAELAGCVNDAHDWAAALETRGFRVELLLDRSATRRRLLEGLAALVSEAADGDTTVITFSGHGTWAPDLDGDEPDARDEGLCPSDLASAGPILADELRVVFAGRRSATKIVAITDASHSGAMARFAPLSARRAGRQTRFLPPDTFLRGSALERAESMVRRPARLSIDANVLTLGAARIELGWDGLFDGRANGAFTFHALRALQPLPAAATYLDWYRAMRQCLPSADYPQTPYLRATGPQRAWRLLD